MSTRKSLIVDDSKNCLIKLYKRNGNLKTCPYVFLRDFPPMIIREANSYAYFVSKKGEQFTVKCTNREYAHFILKGSGQLMVPPNCIAMSDSVILPAIFNINYGMLKIEEDLNPLKIENSFIDHDVLEDDNFEETLNNFNISLSSKNGISLKRIQEGLKHLKLKERHETSSSIGTKSIYISRNCCNYQLYLCENYINEQNHL